jgi:hypothetical protein
MAMPEPSTLNQPYFRIRLTDDEALDAAFAGGDPAENTNATVGTGYWFRIRFAVTETAGGNNDNGYKLQYNLGAAWVDVGLLSDSACGPVVARTSNEYADGATISTRRLSGSGTWLNGEGYGDNSRWLQPEPGQRHDRVPSGGGQRDGFHWQLYQSDDNG